MAVTQAEPAPGGLKKNAIGYISNIVIGVASTAPGYSIAATLGFVVAIEGVGLAAPAVMLVAFLPMFCIAYAYRYMNQADPDCGTTFSWATRGLGPSWGWLGGWAIVATDVIVMASLSQIAAHLHLPAVRLGRGRELARRGDDRRRDLDRPDDADLLPGHRAVRPHPAVACSGSSWSR